MSKQLVLAALCAALIGATAAAGDMADWLWQMAITFDGYPAERTELVNFPALLVLEDGAGGIDFADFKEGGVDLRFTDKAASVVLNYEIERWDAESGKAWVWVQVPHLNNGTVIKAHWGNAVAEQSASATDGSTWSEGFKAVWHMVTDDNNKLVESTANNYVGTLDSSGVGFTTDGYVGGAASFTSSGSGYGAVGGINCGDVSIVGSQTIAMWLKVSNLDLRRNPINKAYGGEGTFNIFQDGRLIYFYGIAGKDGDTHQSHAAPAGTIKIGEWIHVAHVRDVNAHATLHWYINGVEESSATCLYPEVAKSTNPLWIGKGYNYPFNGIIDEVRMSEVVRSADWVWAEWRNMDAPKSFATFGEAGLSNPDLARINNVNLLSRSGVSAQVVGELITNGVDQATVHLFWGPVDGGTNAATWLAGGGASLDVGAMADGAIFTNTISGLNSGDVYFWNYRAVNSGGTAWGRSLGSPFFKTLAAPVVSNEGITDIRSFKVTVSGTLTDGAVAAVELLIGTEDGVWQRSLPLGEFEEGGFRAVITDLVGDKTYFATYRATNICGATVAEPSLSFTTRNTATVLASSGSGYVDVGIPDALQLPANSPFTIEGWVLFKSLTNRDMLYSKGNARSSNGPFSYMVGFADNKLSAYNTAWRGNFAVSRQLNRWYHTAFSFDGTNMAFYLDGELLGTAAFTYTQTATHSVKIGGYSSSSDGNGYKSDVRIWDYARSGDEIRSTMERLLYGNEPGLLGYWPLYDGEGLTAFDATANDSDGVLEGAVWATDSTLVLTPPHIPFLYAPSFILRDPVTGSASFTSSNEVELTDVIVPDGYDRVQISLTGDIDEVDPDGWLDVDDLPERIVFEQPQTDANMTAYLWFTNTAASACLRRAEAAIRYTTVAPVPTVWPTMTRVVVPPAATVITPELVDRGSSGGVSGGDEIGIWLRRLNLLAGPDTNATPDEAWITVSSQGVYNVELVVVNEAGNVATSAVCAVEVLAVGTTASTFYVDKNWTGAELGTATAPYRTIRTAVEAANLTTTEPNTIYIAAGWYGDGANGGSEDYKNGGAADGGIAVTRRTQFYGGYAGWQGGDEFDWVTRQPRATVIDLNKANSRAFHIDRSVQSQITGLFDGLTFCNANHSANGGAIYSYSTHYGNTIINNCLFTNNVTTAEGGAAYLLVAYAANTITFSDFHDNKSKNGGAVCSGSNTTRLTVEDSAFSNNTASAKGGAICFNGSNGPQQSVRRCRFEGNTAGTMGGALFSIDPTVVVEQSVFIDNSAPQGAAIGGNDYWCGSIIIANSLVANNSGGYALQAEGARVYGGYSIGMTHCTVINNSGGGLRFQRTDGTTPGRVVNSIIANNGGYGIYRTKNDYTLANNNVFNNALGDYYNCEPDEASLSADSLFLDEQNGNYRLAINSPCIDAGTNLAVTVDLDGVLRPTRYGYDIGCYEERALPLIVNRTPLVGGDFAEPRAEFLYKDSSMATYAYFVLDTADRGIGTVGAWAQCAAAGEQEQGVIFGALFAGLQPETVYWYRCIASNDYDQVWGEAAQFRTAAGGGATRRWTGAGGNALASNSGNWEGGILPSASDYVVFANTDTAITWDAGVNGLGDTVAHWTQLEDFSGTITFRTVYPGQGNFTNFTITGDAIVANGIWAHAQNTAAQVYRLAVTVGGDFLFGQSAKITASNLGYYNAGPGRQPAVGGSKWGAASHGGRGGEQGLEWGASNVYGSVMMPIDLGSGGSNPGGRGGGAISLNVGGLFECLGGIEANAGNVNSAGGSILITAGTLSGNGVIQASNPTSGSYASGGGGRIAIYLTRPGAAIADFRGVVRANTIHDGAARRGAAGTVYLVAPVDAPGGRLVIDNQAQVPTHYTTLPENDGIGRACSLTLSTTGWLRLQRNYIVRDLTLGSGARLDLSGSQVTVSGVLSIAGDASFKPGAYAAAAFGNEVQDSSDLLIGRIIIPAPGTILMLR